MTERPVAKPELGTKRICPNCGAKYYDLNRDPIVCPKCNALHATGAIASPVTAAEDEDVEVEPEDEGVEFVSLEEAVPAESEEETSDLEVPGEAVEVDVDADDAALIDETDDEVSDVVRGAEEDDEER
jgi:uncharacterized protein (TIGR02300 family)